jgi:D-arabinose 1-dehydrogenase-like Zn-dependent alcohol dehydrogenase
MKAAAAFFSMPFHGFSSFWETAMKKRICVIDGQGGGIGTTLIKYLKAAYGERIELIALGTNAIATAQMLKSGANKGATGENAIARTVRDVDFILGPIAITWANAMLGEVTSIMAEAVMASPALKILLPLSQEQVEIVGVLNEPLPHLVQNAVEDKIKEAINHV